MQRVYFHDQLTTEGNTHRLYENPLDILIARTADEVQPVLEKLEKHRALGKYLAGYCAYELGMVLEKKLSGLLGSSSFNRAPLLMFGVFDKCENKELLSDGYGCISDLRPAWSEAKYTEEFNKIMVYIRAGDVYQINLTFPMRGQYTGSAPAIYNNLKQAQPVRYGGMVSLGETDIVTLSPELFFEKRGDMISMRPMKGTARRGRSAVEDKALAAYLQADEKNRAENLMIVDLLRNDISRIAKTGSVEVTDLFTIETYPSLHTMTSGIRAEVDDISFEDVLRAMFPCGSITGAPKIRAMEIINELECTPRGAYCGAIGYIDPPQAGGDMCFNVAIRTLVLNADKSCSYQVGSGIVADSIARDEYAECLLKASFLHTDFGLIETFGWHEACGFMHQSLHLQRLAESAKTLGFDYKKSAVITALDNTVQNFVGPHKVRLELAKNGDITCTSVPLVLQSSDYILPLSLSKNPVSSTDIYRVHKTTKRTFLEGELKRISKQTGCKEVLFFNEKGALCEGSYTNIFIVQSGQMFTPPISCGLLPGVLRHVLIGTKQATEKVLYKEDLLGADEIYIGNSARGLMRARLTSTSEV